MQRCSALSHSPGYRFRWVRRSAESDQDAVSGGFTLLELLIVTIIVGTLAAMSAPRLQRARDQAMVARAAADIRVLEAELEVYIQENFFPPVSLAAVGRAGMLDPWGRPYRYLQINTGSGGGGASSGGRKDKFLVPLNSDYDLYSAGADGESKAPLSAKASQDDILRALDGAFVGLAKDF